MKGSNILCRQRKLFLHRIEYKTVYSYIRNLIISQNITQKITQRSLNRSEPIHEINFICFYKVMFRTRFQINQLISFSPAKSHLIFPINKTNIVKFYLGSRLEFRPVDDPNTELDKSYERYGNHIKLQFLWKINFN